MLRIRFYLIRLQLNSGVVQHGLFRQKSWSVKYATSIRRRRT